MPAVRRSTVARCRAATGIIDVMAPDSLPLARQLAGEVLSLPMGPHLTAAMQQAVIEAVLSAA